MKFLNYQKKLNKRVYFAQIVQIAGAQSGQPLELVPTHVQHRKLGQLVEWKELGELVSAQIACEQLFEIVELGRQTGQFVVGKVEVF